VFGLSDGVCDSSEEHSAAEHGHPVTIARSLLCGSPWCPGFIGSCIMIVGLRFSPSVNYFTALWRAPLFTLAWQHPRAIIGGPAQLFRRPFQRHAR